VPEVLPVDELHGDEQPTAMGRQVEHGHHVGMTKRCDRLRFAPQLLGRARDVGVPDQLERDRPSQRLVGGQIDASHATVAERPEHRVATQSRSCRQLDVAARGPIVAGGGPISVHQDILHCTT
jgi:hypothetical protein